VLKGFGNNAQDGTEGAIYRNAFGTYLHGSLLPKNPHFADYLIELALKRSYGLSWRGNFGELDGLSIANGAHVSEHANGHSTPEPENWDRIELEDTVDVPGVIIDPLVTLSSLDDSLEWEAHCAILERLGLHSVANAVLRSR